MTTRKIKICGLTQSEQIVDLESNENIAYTGFIFYEKSPRNACSLTVVPPKKSNVKRVGVFVNPSIEDIMDKINPFQLDMVQLHGNETTEFCEELIAKGITVSKAFGIAEAKDLDQLRPYDNIGIEHFVLDTKTIHYGGSGKQYDWDILLNYAFATPFLLSGGIGPDDSDKLKKFTPSKCIGYDLNSKFESSPGIKSLDLIQGFITDYYELVND